MELQSSSKNKLTLLLVTFLFLNFIKAQSTDVTYDDYGSTDISTSTDTSYYDDNIPVTSPSTDPEVCSRCQSMVNRPSSFDNLDYFYYFKPQRASGNNFRGNYGNFGNSPFYSNWMMGMNSNQGNSQSNRGDFISMGNGRNGGNGGNRNSCNTRKCTQGQRTQNRIKNRRRNRQGNQQRNQQGNQQRFQNNGINKMRSGNQNRNEKSSKNCFDWLAW